MAAPENENPVIAARKPTVEKLKAGETYHWCACGKTGSQPFCDGSHVGSKFTPVAFTPEEDGDAYLCMCRRTGNPPYCDGTHATLKDEPEAAPATSSTGKAPTATATPEEPSVARIHELAKHGLERSGHHGEMTSMGVPGPTLPRWDDIQVLPGQMAVKPLLDDANVGTELVIGPNAKKPLELAIPVFVSDMSYGALSEEAKVSLARGAQLAGTGICSGEGGMLPEEQAECEAYLYELASAKFGYSEEHLTKVQAFHFKDGQAAKTGTGGHLSANKVVGKIAQVRNIPEGTPAISPATFADLNTPEDYKRFSDRVREVSGGIPIGMKLSANRIEQDIEFALEAGVDYIILDGRGGGTGAAPRIFRDHISVPTIPALARARHYLDKVKRPDVTLIITGGLRMPEDFAKALCMGADGIAIANSAIQSIGCVAARMCHTNNCPTGVATQKPSLRSRLNVDESSQKLARFLKASVELMSVLARACGHNHLNQFTKSDITSWKREVADLAGIDFAGYSSER